MLLHIRKEKPIFLDIGAKIGLHSLPVAQSGFDVYAVEPITCSIDRVTDMIIKPDSSSFT